MRKSLQDISKEDIMERTHEDGHSQGDSFRSYQRVSQYKKQLLFGLVFSQGRKIKEAAYELGIKYGTAKTIIFLYRKKKHLRKTNRRKIDTTGLRTAGFREVRQIDGKRDVEISISNAGEVQHSYQYFCRLFGQSLSYGSSTASSPVQY